MSTSVDLTQKWTEPEHEAELQEGVPTAGEVCGEGQSWITHSS